eukprot:88160-Chlamydomonas_euryale.AAC.1
MPAWPACAILTPRVLPPATSRLASSPPAACAGTRADSSCASLPPPLRSPPAVVPHEHAAIQKASSASGCGIGNHRSASSNQQSGRQRAAQKGGTPTGTQVSMGRLKPGPSELNSDKCGTCTGNRTRADPCINSAPCMHAVSCVRERHMLRAAAPP